MAFTVVKVVMPRGLNSFEHYQKEGIRLVTTPNGQNIQADQDRLGNTCHLSYLEGQSHLGQLNNTLH